MILVAGFGWLLLVLSFVGVLPAFCWWLGCGGWLVSWFGFGLTIAWLVGLGFTLTGDFWAAGFMMFDCWICCLFSLLAWMFNFCGFAVVVAVGGYG